VQGDSQLLVYCVSIPYLRVTHNILVDDKEETFSVSIPYLRVTHYAVTLLSLPPEKGFNPLSTGHARRPWIVPAELLEGFNPLSTGHAPD